MAQTVAQAAAPRPARTASLAARTASGGMARSAAPSSSAASSGPSAGTTRLTRPIASASRAVIVRPVRISSIARALPIARVSRCVPPAPGMTPSLISGWPNRASSPATIMSQVIASSQPPPRANPRTAAISGMRVAAIRSQAANRSSTRRVTGVWRASSRMSAPAANARVARAGQDDGPAGRVGVERRERVGELVEEVEAQGVEDVRALERDERDALERAVAARRPGTRRRRAGRRPAGRWRSARSGSTRSLRPRQQ